MDNAIKIIQKIFSLFISSTLLLLVVCSLICSDEKQIFPLEETKRNVLFAVGVMQLALGNLGFSKIYNKNSQLYKNLIASKTNKASALCTSFLIFLAFTEASAIVGFIYGLSTGCKDSSYLFLILGSLISYLFWFPKEYKIKELIG